MKARTAAILSTVLIVFGATVLLRAQGTTFLAKVYLGTGACLLSTGSGTPEAAVTGTICDLFLRTNGAAGTVAYLKESGTATNTGWGAVATEAGTATFTNKTLNAESTGNVITVPFKVWLQSGWCQNVTPGSTWSSPATDPAVLACNTGTNTKKATWDFADGANTLSIQNSLMLAADFTGTVDLAFKWFTSATSGAVVWQAASICVADAETSDPAFNTASTVTDTAKGTTLQDNDAAITGLTITGCAAGETLYLKMSRDPAHASDTLAATASLRGVELTFRRAM